MVKDEIISADIQILDNPGFGLIQVYGNGKYRFLKRFYPTLSENQIAVQLIKGNEQIIQIYRDDGYYFNHIILSFLN